MPTTDPRVDAYISKAQPFAQPILTEIRRRMHQALPDLVETIKWNAPFFLHQGQILASMSGFKHHAKFLIWAAGGMYAGAPETLDVASVKELPAANPFIKRIKDAAATAAKANGKKEKVGGAPKKATPAGRTGKVAARPAVKRPTGTKAKAKKKTRP